MTMDHKFTHQLKVWLDTPADVRDYALGALYVLKLTGNKVLYTNLMADLEGRREYVDAQIERHFEFRAAQCPDFAPGARDVDAVAADVVDRNISLAAKADVHKTGRRADHDSLPDEVKARYVENLDLLRRMREVHLQLRRLPQGDDADAVAARRPLVKELTTLDKRLHANWKAYDSFKA